MTSKTPWLSAREERAWRRWVMLNAELSATLQREMQLDSQLSMSDYEVLIHLTDRVDGRLRVSDLAKMLLWELSRVSHHVTRMERRGLVGRSECPEDGRGAFVLVTDEGRRAIERAAPGHAASVRRLVFDVIDPEEVERLHAILEKIHAGLGASDDPSGQAQHASVTS